MAQTVEQEMRSFLRRWESSGKSLRWFAEEEGVSYRRALYWRSKLAPVDDAAGEPGLVEVQLTAPVVPSEPFEIHLAGGRRLRVPVDFDEVALQRLVRTLEQC